MLDADAERFERSLKETRPGLHLCMAIHEAQVAVQQIRRLEALGGPRRQSAVDSWRRAYIQSCNRAAEAIDALWDRYRWPTDGARDRRFEWTPKEIG